MTFTNGHIPIAHIVLPPGATMEMKADAERALSDVIAAGTLVNAEFVEQRVEALPEPHGPHLLANIAANATADGVIRTVKKLVPEVAKVVIGDWEDDEFQIRVGDAQGECAEPLRAAASEAVGAVIALGVPFRVAGLRPSERTPSRDTFVTAAQTNARLREIALEDEARFAKRVMTLVENDVAESVSLIDHLDGEKICTTIGGPDAASVGTFLPLYDRVLLLLVPDQQPADYYVRHYGLSEAAFIEYVKARKIVPIFKFELGRYPEPVWRRFVEDPSLPFATSRDLDYLCARNVWLSSGWLRELRKDREVSAVMHRLLSNFDGNSPYMRSVAGVFRMVLLGAEAFEGDMWHRGHLGAWQYSAALPFLEAFRQLVRDKPNADMARIEAESAAMHLAISQALGAATHEGLVSNERLLLEVAKAFGGESTALFSVSQATRLAEVLKGLELSFSEAIPPNEYVQIFDEANTKRMRTLVAELVQREERLSELELRELVQRYNQGVDRIARNAVEKADVSLVASGAGAATGLPLLKTALETGASVGGKLGRMLDARTGTVLDRMRGWINRVPAQSVRLYKIRRRLRAAAR
ncbi:MAG: hypothetical protein JO257_07490 [Deltaproteobacteria bacterium]|nr:hypothetical protein [Deltaproteobacteria bacterium]